MNAGTLPPAVPVGIKSIAFFAFVHAVSAFPTDVDTLPNWISIVPKSAWMSVILFYNVLIPTKNLPVDVTFPFITSSIAIDTEHPTPFTVF